MNTYFIRGFQGRDSQETAAVIQARDTNHAAELLISKLSELGLKQDINAASIEWFVGKFPRAIILCDGTF